MRAAGNVAEIVSFGKVSKLLGRVLRAIVTHQGFWYTKSCEYGFQNFDDAG